MYKKILALIFLSGILNISNAEKNYSPSSTKELRRSLILTPGYMERTFNSNDSMKYGPLTLMQLSSKGFDALINASGEYKVIAGMLYLLPQSWFSLANNVVYHEFGHARAKASYKVGYTYYASHVSTDPTIKTDYAYGLYLQKFLNPSYFLDGAMTSATSTAKEIGKQLSYLPDIFLNRITPISFNKGRTALNKQKMGLELSTEEQNNLNNLSADVGLYFDVGGLNNNTRYAQQISDLIFKNNGHLIYFPDYFVGKTTPLFYWLLLGSHGDVGSIVYNYNKQNLDIRGPDIALGSAASLLLSSTTWTFVYSAFTELPKGSFIVRPPIWHGWRLPDLNFYLTSQGLSFEIVTGYRFNDNWYAGLSTEMVYKGNSAYEFGPSVGYNFNTSLGRIDLSCQLIIGNKLEMGGNIGAEWTSPHESWSVGLKYIYHNALTLVGERNIPFLASGFMSGGEPSLVNHEANVTLSYNY